MIPTIFKTILEKARNLFTIKDTHTVEFGTYATVNTSTGRVESGGTGATQIPVGLIDAEQDGIDSRLTGNTAGTAKASVRNGLIVTTSVVGVSSAANFMADVYLIDKDDLSLTPPSGSYPCGYVYRWISSTTCEVYLYTHAEMKLKKDLIDGIAAVAP